MEHPNFFILLELPCGESNAATIEAAIKKKQADWSRDCNHPSKGIQAQQHLNMLKDIRAVMLNDAARGAEAVECEKIRKTSEIDRWKEVDQAITVLASAGFLLKSQVQGLVNQFKGKVPEADLLKRIKVPIRDDAVEAIEAKPTLEKSKFDEIVNRLKIVDKKDLYDFLDLPRTSSLAALVKRAKELDVEIRKQTKDAEATAKQGLLGYCLDLFKDDAGRTRYNNSLEQQGLDELTPILEAAGGVKSEISAAVFEQLLHRAQELGVPLEDARRYIRSYAKKRGWAIVVPGQSNTFKLRRCGSCNTTNPEKAERCRTCGEPLNVACPKCATVNSSERSACTKCGFSVGDGFLVRRLQRDAELAIARGDFVQAERLLNEAEIYWPGAEPTKALRDRVTQGRVAEKQALDGVHKAFTARNLIEARRLLVEARRQLPADPQLAKLEADIETRMKRAEAFIAQGRQSERAGRLDEALDAYLAAQQECQDHPDAANGLAKCPPEIPRAIQVHPASTGISLVWQASTSRGALQYRVVRKARAEPRSPIDGVVLVERMAGLSYADSNAEPGEWYWYAVFAERGGVFSRRAATAGPAVRVSDVSGLRSRGGNRAVVLEWQPPAKAARVEVWRQLNTEPRKRGDGTQVVGVALNGATEEQLMNGIVYVYRVITVFDGPDGKPLYSDGVTCTVMPCEPPQPVTDVVVTRGAGFFEARWTPPAKGQVSLYATPTRPVHQKGDLLALADLSALGKPVPSQGPHAARGPIPPETEMHLLPVTVLESVAVVGQATAISWIDDVTDLNGRCTGDHLHLQWTWPKNIRTVAVLYRTDAYPEGPDDPLATSLICFQEQYQLHGSFRPAVAESDRFFVAVYCRVNHNGVWRFSAAGSSARCEIAAQEHRRVYYRLEPVPGGFFAGLGSLLQKLDGHGTSPKDPAGYRVVLTTDKPTILPALTLRFKPDGYPQNPRQGNEVAMLADGQPLAPHEPWTWGVDSIETLDIKNTRLFCVHDEDCQWLELVAR